MRPAGVRARATSIASAGRSRTTSITRATSSAAWPFGRAPRPSLLTSPTSSRSTDRFAKTIVFCVDQEHADEMRRALSNRNTDLVRTHPDYACRVTAAEGDIGRGHLSNFQDVERRTPVILTTSQMLTT
jgi:hypothetical protein